jgi:predicted deacylase
MHELDPAEMAGQVILIPRLNVPACAASRRESPMDGVNMNRAFPGDPRGSMTYRIAHFVTSRIFPRVDVVIDIHSAGRGMQFALCSSFHQVTDPKQYEEMKLIAGLFDTPFIMIYSSEMAHGLLTDEAEAMDKITIGSEFGHSAGVWHLGVKHAYEGIKNVLKHYGILPGQVERIAPERETPPRLVAAIHLNSYTPAPISGVFEPILEVGARVEQGQLVGRLFDFERVDTAPMKISAPRSGYLIMQSFQAPVTKGDTMLVVAEEVV